jgi:hypothetical protein
MTAAAPIEPQLHFPLPDEPERGGPWKTIRQVAEALDVSPGHVRNLFDSGKIDMVIRIDSGESVGIGSDYRILANSYQRYQAGDKSPVDYEAVILAHLCCLPAALSSTHVAIHFNISDKLVVRLTPHFFDAASARSSKVYFRASRRQVLAFVNKRRIQ